jgi:hypothetical protein
MFAAQTDAEKALSLLLPDGADPATTIELACHVAFLVHDRDVLTGLTDVVRADPDLAAGLLVTLAAMVDVDQRPDDLIAWLGTPASRQQDTVRTAGALTEARADYDDAGGDTLPEVTLETMREMIHASKLHGVVQPCGTPAAHARHVKRKQKPCFRCTRARYLYDQATPDERKLLTTPITAPGHTVRCLCHSKRPARAQKCGTRYGYETHISRGEDPCVACRKARSQYDADRHEKILAQQGKTKSRQRKRWADVQIELPDNADPVRVTATGGAEIPDRTAA